METVKDKLKQKIISLAFYIAVFIYLEFSLHISVYGSLDGRIIYPILAAFVYGGFLYLLTAAFPEKAAKVIAIVVISLFTLYFEVQLVYHCIFGSFMPLAQVGMGADAVTSFFSQMLYAMGVNIGKIILVLVPVPVAIVLIVKGIIRFHPLTLIQIPLYTVVVGIFILCSSLIYTNTGITDMLIDPNTSVEASVKTAGPIVTAAQEIKGMIFPSIRDRELAAINIGDGQGDGEKNAIFDFDTLDDSISQYLSTVEATSKNQYTGIAKDYNLITICAEAFSPLIIDSELTPTLYKLSTNGFVFNNFYNSFPNTTTNGEYSFCTGLFPDMSRNKVDSSFNRSADNYLPLCLGSLYSSMGYDAYAYHNYYGTFYDRHITHPNMGYDFKAILSGLDMEVGAPSSDLDMIEASMPDYINSTEPFHVYYMTYSGHYQYNWDNDMAEKNRERVEHLDLSDEAKAYIACNLELEDALTALMEGLEAAGQADKTVIVLSADHYPYGLNGNQYDELAGSHVDTTFERYRNAFICYVPGIDKVEIDDYCCTPDILPTVLNIMGIEYDSRLFAGRDVLSDAPHIAVLADHSYITEEFKYNAETGKAETHNGEAVDPATVEKYCSYVDNMFTLSAMILDEDYYATLYGHTDRTEKPKVVNYEDIDAGQVYIESTVTFMVSQGYMEPESERMFGINSPGTVREFIEVLYRIKGINDENQAHETAIAEGVVTEQELNSEEAATYLDIANIIYRICAQGEIPEGLEELSAKYPHIGYDDLVSLKYCYDRSIIVGTADTVSYEMYSETITRYHIAAYLQRLYLHDMI